MLAVYEATQRAAAHARAGKGPYLLECKTFRMTGHSAHDAAHYVPKDLFEEWGKLDPIVRLEKRMLDEALGHAGGDRRGACRHRARGGRRGGMGRAEPLPRCRRRCWTTCTRAQLTHVHYLPGSDSRRTLGGDGARPQRVLHRRGHRRIRRRVQGDGGLPGALRRAARGGYADLGSGDCGRVDRRGADGTAAGGGDAVRGFHLLRLRPDRQFRRQVPVPLECGGAHRDPLAFRRRHSRRTVPFAESRDVVRAHAGPEGGLSGDGVRRQGADQIGHPRQRPGAVLRAQGSVPQDQGRPARERVHGADRQGEGGARRARPEHHHVRRDGLDGAGSRGDTGRRRLRRGGGGPAHAGAAGSRDGLRQRTQDIARRCCCTRTRARAEWRENSRPRSRRTSSNIWTGRLCG